MSGSHGLLRVALCMLSLLILGKSLCQASSSASYDGKPLTFSIENKTFGQVMELFKEKTGLEYDIPGDLRGFNLPLVEIKNLTLKTALLKVLEGSNYDYILIASPDDAERIVKLLIMGRSSKIASSGGSAPGSATRAMNKPPIVEDPFGGDMGLDEGQVESAPVSGVPPQLNPPFQGAQPNPNVVQPGQQPGQIQPQFSPPQPGQAQPGQPVQPVNPYVIPENRRSPF